MALNPEETVKGILNGDRKALAKALTAVENDSAGSGRIMDLIEPHEGGAFIIGITGPPGAGKSTFTGRLAARLRGLGKKVGVIAVDPSSPFSGGAILGDRIRMRSHALDSGVFVRSMGSRGALGGLSLKTSKAAKLMDAFGMDCVIIETVGVGQSEVEIASAADMVAVVLAPGFGDEIQALKAGILEIADIFVVNKSDCPGAEKLALELSRETAEAAAPSAVLKCSSLNDEGFDEIMAEIGSKKAMLMESGELAKRRSLRRSRELAEMIEDGIRKMAEERIEAAGGLSGILEKAGSVRSAAALAMEAIRKALEQQ